MGGATRNTQPAAFCLLLSAFFFNCARRGQEAGEQDWAGAQREKAAAAGEQQSREREDVVERARRVPGGLAEEEREGQQPRADEETDQAREEGDPYLPHVNGTSLTARLLSAARARVQNQAQVFSPPLDAFERVAAHD